MKSSMRIAIHSVSADDSTDEQTLVVNVTVERRQPDVDAPRDDKTLQHITWIDVESSAHESYAISCIRL